MHFQPPYTGILYPRKEYGNLHHEDIHRCVCSEMIYWTCEIQESEQRFNKRLFQHVCLPTEFIPANVFKYYLSIVLTVFKYIRGYWFVRSGAYNCPPLADPHRGFRAAKVQTFFHIRKGRAQKKDSLTIVRPPTIQYPNNPFRLDPLQPQNREPTIFGCLILK